MVDYVLNVCHDSSMRPPLVRFQNGLWPFFPPFFFIPEAIKELQDFPLVNTKLLFHLAEPFVALTATPPPLSSLCLG